MRLTLFTGRRSMSVLIVQLGFALAGTSDSLTPDPCPVEESSLVVRHEGDCYVLNTKRMFWKDAKEYCYNRSATLAKISTDFPDDAQLLLKEELFKQRCFCVWIGATYVEGDWQWIDGSPTSGVKWDFSVLDLSRKLSPLEPVEDWEKTKERFKCGRFCTGFELSDAVSWEPGPCESEFCFICQYSLASVEGSTTRTTTAQLPPPPTTTTTTTTTPPPPTTTTTITTTTTTKRFTPTAARPVRISRRQRKPVQVYPVIRKFPGSKIIGAPLFRKRFPEVTMCARACTKKSVCGMFNFRTSSGHCIGFSRETEVTFTDHPEWDRWQ